MRKGQNELIAKATKNGATNEQLKALSNETLTLDQLACMYEMFQKVKGIPVKEAVWFVSRDNKSPKTDDFWFSKSYWNRSLTKSDWDNLSQDFKNDPNLFCYILGAVSRIDPHINRIDAANELLAHNKEAAYLTSKYQCPMNFIEIKGWPRGSGAKNRTFSIDFLKYVLDCIGAILKYYENDKKLQEDVQNMNLDFLKNYHRRLQQMKSATIGVENQEAYKMFLCKQIDLTQKKMTKKEVNPKDVPSFIWQIAGGKIEYIEQCYANKVDPDTLAEAYIKKKRLFPKDDPVLPEYTPGTTEYLDANRVIPDDRALLFVDLAVHFPYNNPEIVFMDMDIITKTDINSHLSLNAIGKRVKDRTNLASRNGGVITNSYPNKEFLTLRRKNGKKVTKYGYPIYGTPDELNSIEGLALHIGILDRWSTLILPVHLDLKENYEGTAISIKITGVYEPDATTTIDVTCSKKAEDNIGWMIDSYSSDPEGNEKGLKAVDTNYESILGIAPEDKNGYITLNTMEKKRIVTI